VKGKKIIKKITSYFKEYVQPHSIQMIISISFTLVAVISMGFLAVTIYNRLVDRMEKMNIESTEQQLNQTSINLETYLRNMRRISDAMYYTVIKDKDLAADTMDQEMNLLYESNKDNLISIACYTNDGEMIAAAPVETEKTNINILKQKWFTDAVGQMENLHFSAPHVQNLFDSVSFRYYWVISLSRAVELTSNGNTALGVLLVDMNYSSIEQLFNKVNMNNSSEYVYLMDNDGEIIYHPKQNLIYTHLYDENNTAAAGYDDGTCEETFEGARRLITVKTVSYTGWKIVSVVPLSSFNMGLSTTRYFVILIVTIMMLAIIMLNQLVSARIAKPIQKLDASIKKLEAGDLNIDIDVGGSQEIEHLGKTLRSVVAQLRQLMNDIVVEQEKKRKSELDALQSQINPHFLYNTLDSIVWMIEGERYDEAVFMVTELASLFRISLSSGKTIISLEDEIKHAQNYINIQKVRYKNKFEATFEVSPEILQCCTVKLVLQPLLENAIYYGVEYMDGDGEIQVKGYRNNDDIYIEIRDNGLGMPEEVVDQLLTADNRIRKTGSGVGLLNVHNRIKLRFGAAYGLEIESQPDEGTTVRVHLPYLLYTPETIKSLENGSSKQVKEEFR
jgi:two-component system sensor histidine kinase YesM